MHQTPHSALALLALSLTAPALAGPAKSTPWVMTGVVRNAAGQPLEGVEVSAHNTVYYNVNVLARTDRQGRYRLDLPHEIGTWAPYATLKRSWGNQTFIFTVYPDDDSAFAARDGGVRDFVWRVQGNRGNGVLGQKVNVYYGGGDVDEDSCELTFTPVGPLIDGSTGKTFKRKCGPITDVAVGHYRISATHAPGGTPVPLEVKAEGQGAYADVTVGTFRETLYGIRMELSYRTPQK
ncbi:carboxypeptidase-like regulatory domain-containing protein [Deinococcus hopiensis]|uniref:Carboxypeptidase regulatory-like domain-containing protein n=1 Tax=Deinococcus hopiensis KR-140 TaxID=695939 RepID=A0A1W1UDB3_9DEIO|nr:carboxypeptidase-like regulatory domain-containing protein [Deinococcus hopiensis]SMB79012.1 hypothetical protein SAMN00790413_05726 [Deinococcus hopiensis KR-140]